jgi:phospholipid-binding lipoprotein MlaA
VSVVARPVRGARRLAAATAALALLAGCASNPKDPFEPFNRASYELNQNVDRAVARPLAQAYKKVVPALVREGVGNFFANLTDSASALNCALQLKLECAAENALRFGFNSVFGFAGVLDIAGELGIPRTRTDFGITLGKYGVPAGPYVMLPLVGPTTVRDMLGGRFGPDRYTDPLHYSSDDVSINGLRLLNVVNTRAELLAVTNLFMAVAIDPYTFSRDAYLQRRQNQVYDGEPPDEDVEPAPAPGPLPVRPRSPASAPAAAAPPAR